MTRAVRIQADRSTRGVESTGPPGSDRRPIWGCRPDGSGPSQSFASDESAIIDEFTERWDLGESPRIEEFLGRIDPASVELAVGLIYRQFCLEEADGSAPSSEHYLDRFADYRDALGRLFRLHDAVTGSEVVRWGAPGSIDPEPFEPELPLEGDRIGPFLLGKELGAGAFARVFLAEQTDLGGRKVVVKVSSRPSREPWLLARARHPHIVEIISQFEVDEGDLQLICMPFRGGATLARVLEEIGRRGERPSSGRDLLAALDAVAADYPEGQRSQTARDIVAGSSADRSLAWMVARLAEALDFASTLKVAHGDIKPSNILISADACPMLLDFNLAQDWAIDEEESGPIERGGTLAYMAPERLRTLAGLDGRSPQAGSTAEPHASDLYSLGLVFLEMLTGRMPSVPPEAAPAPRGRRQAAARFRESAGRLAELRSRLSCRELIGRHGGGRISPALRAILGCCLDPDPVRRYRRGQELATDLDRWRADRPLVYAREGGLYASGRRLRRARRPILATAAVILASACAGYGVRFALNSRTIDGWKWLGLKKVAGSWDAPQTRVFGFLRIPKAGNLGVNSFSPSSGLADPEVSDGSTHRPEARSKAMEIATLALSDYQLLAPEDWRGRDDVRFLPQDEREDLELWLMEQAYRYCHELACRPDSPGDWERAIAAVNHLFSAEPPVAFARLRSRLEHAMAELTARQGGPGAESRPREASLPLGTGDRVPPWLDEYILGVALECDSASPAPLDGPSSDDGVGTADEKILGHYRATLAHRPASFWANYRASVLCNRLGRPLDTSNHLEQCWRRRPGNPTIRGQLAGSLCVQNRLDEALTECDRAIAIDPDRAEYFRTRAWIAAELGRPEEVRDALHHFEILSGVIPPGMLGSRFPALPTRRPPKSPGLQLANNRDRTDSATPYGMIAIQGRLVRPNPGDIETRFNLARSLLTNSRDLEQGLAELDKILALDPDYLHARVYRATHMIRSGAVEECGREIERILDHPGLPDFLEEVPDVVARLLDISQSYMKRGHHDKALALARKSLGFAESVDMHVGRAHYTIARASALIAGDNPTVIDEAAAHLARAFAQNREGFRRWYATDRSFDAIRARLDDRIVAAERSIPSLQPLQTATSRIVSQQAD